MNKPHIGWRPKWFATQIGSLPNWRPQLEKKIGAFTVPESSEFFAMPLSAY